MGVCEDEIKSLEKLFYDVLSLNEQDQKRVKGLINKIQRERERNLEVA